VSQHRFDSVGDFEGLTYFNHTLFVLRSDGRLTEWPNFPSDDDALKQTMLPLLTSDNEGLCSDPAHHRILIAAKSKPSDRKEKSERYIYGYDLTSNQLQEKPLYSLNLQALEENARRFNIEQTETNAKGKVKPFNFRPASLAVHPVSDEIYIISAADKLLVVINRKGEVTFMKSLHPETFAKAEGITFLDDGTLIITNEAAGKMATLYVFEMI
jgi:uncharacterized protein YjiK